MFIDKLKIFFLFITIIGTIFFIYLVIKNYNFDNSNLDEKILKKIYEKQIILQNLSLKKFAVKEKFPIIISNKMPSNLFGAATLTTDDKIVIYLNKKRFKESVDYMISDVLPHEYAHAIMFKLKDISNKNGGHTKKWQSICKALNGLRCNRFVNNQDIIINKTSFF
ncbi:MAG: SprT-like domain-containing protein [Halarcobacter sp.]